MTYAQLEKTGRETSFFLNMYLRDSRVLDYLMTRVDWDEKTLVVMGGSMGVQQGPVAPLPMIESEHDNLTPGKGRACPVRTNEILDVIVHGGTFTPKCAK